MLLEMKKFGNILNSRPAGMEAVLRAKQIINGSSDPIGVVLDFSGVSGTTQSFIHALISEPIRRFRDVALEKIHYKNCSDVVKEVIKTVSEYMQESFNSA